MKETRAFNKLCEQSNKMEALQEALRAKRGDDKSKPLDMDYDPLKGKKYGHLNSQDIEKRIQAQVSALTNITEETNLLKEIKDILDELNSILIVFQQQELVIQTMTGELGEYDHVEDDEEEGNFRFSESSQRMHIKRRNAKSRKRLLQRVRKYEHDVEKLEAEATRTHDAVSSFGFILNVYTKC